MVRERRRFRQRWNPQIVRRAEAPDQRKQQHRGHKKQARPDDVIPHLGPALQPLDVQRHNVIQHQHAQPHQVENVAQQHRSRHRRGQHLRLELVDVPRNQRQESHRDRAANPIASRSDKHPELRRKHQPQLVRTELLPHPMRKRPRNMRRSMLQRQIDPKREHMRHRVHEPHQHNRKQRRPKQPPSTKEQHRSRGIGKRHSRMRRQKDRPRRRKDELENRMIAQVHQSHRRHQDRQPPPAAIHLPTQRTPRPQDQNQRHHRHKPANRLQRIVGPQRIQSVRSGVHRKHPHHRQQRRQASRYRQTQPSQPRPVRSLQLAPCFLDRRQPHRFHTRPAPCILVEPQRLLAPPQPVPARHHQPARRAHQRQYRRRILRRVHTPILRMNRGCNRQHKHDPQEVKQIFHNALTFANYPTPNFTVNAPPVIFRRTTYCAARFATKPLILGNFQPAAVPASPLHKFRGIAPATPRCIPHPHRNERSQIGKKF